MDWWQAGALGLQGLGALFGGGGAEERPMNTGMTNPGQIDLLNRLMQAYQSGSGEFGFGPAAQQGMATMQQQMGQRGIGMGSGVAQGAISQMLAQAMQGDANNRRQYGMGLVGASPGSMFNYDRLGHGMRRGAF